MLFFVSRPDSTAGSRERTIDVALEEGGMSSEQIVVGEGDLVTLRMTSERLVEVHVHGYDFEEEIEPGEPAVLSFEADTTGRFEIEDHETQEELGSLVVEPR